jgi:hypothetical protein
METAMYVSMSAFGIGVIALTFAQWVAVVWRRVFG